MKRRILLGLAVLLGTPLVVHAGPAGSEGDWKAADQAFKAFITPLLESARRAHNDPTIQDAEFRSALVLKYLPEFRLFVTTGPYDGKSKIFLVNKAARIFDLGDGTWSGSETEYRVQRIPEFLKTRKLPVRTAEEALEVAALFDEIRGSANYVGFLQLNTAGFRVFDSRVLSQHYGSPVNWKMSAERRGANWIVTREYVGPPAMIQRPPVYEISVDDKQLFVDLRDRRSPLPL